MKSPVAQTRKCPEYGQLFSLHCRNFDTSQTLGPRNTAQPFLWLARLRTPQNYEIKEASAKRIPSSVVSSSPILTFNTVGFADGEYYKFL
jgi:hypothetical protein